jgi:predicted type IV restriction endonuclease
MKEKLTAFITNLRNDRRVLSFDEASTKQALVLRLFSILGWDPFDIEEVCPEYSVGGKRVDYSLRVSNANKVFVEVKRLNEPLDIHQEQLLGYSFQEGVKQAILTNGLTWWFYLPLNEGSWEQRRYFTVDLLQQEPEAISGHLIDFLSKENVASGKAVQNSEALYKSHHKKTVLDSTIPKAWNKIIVESDDLLLELISETTEKLSGFRPDIESVEKFLTTHVSSFIIGQEVANARVELNNQKKSETIKVPGSYSGNTLISFTFLGKKYQAKIWKDLLTTVAEILYQTYKTDFYKVTSMRGTKRNYFSKTADDLREPRKVSNSGLFVETHWSANSIVRVTLDLIALFGYTDKDLKIDIQ